MYGSWDIEKESRDHNPYSLNLWPDPDRPRCPISNDKRLLAIVFDLRLGHIAFAAALHRFPGREVTLRERTRIIRSSERPEDVEYALRVLAEDDVTPSASGPPPRSR